MAKQYFIVVNEETDTHSYFLNWPITSLMGKINTDNVGDAGS